MSRRCEVCEEPATCFCGGLDVPCLAFCDEHGDEHEANCPDVERGAAWMNRIEASTTGNTGEGSGSDAG